MAADGENRGGQTFHDLARRDDVATVVVIRHVPDDEVEEHHRQELREAHHAELKRAVRQRVNLPANRDRLDLERQR